jgi:Tfp pilus assembly protein PilF
MLQRVPEGSIARSEQTVFGGNRESILREKGASMKRAFVTSSLVLAALLMTAVGCRSGGGDLSSAATQRRFGVRMAKMNLWREARFRFQRATQIDPQNAMTHNNLAVAFEATGDFDNAAKEYREALRLDRSNQYIQKNYSRFVEFTQKAKKRQQQPLTSAAAAAAATTTAAAPATATPAPADAPVTTSTTTTNPPGEGL